MSGPVADGSEVLTDRIGLVAVLALLVGNAISVPIYVLSGTLAGSAGPSVIVAAVLAAIPAGFVVLYNALLGSAMPVAGGLYVYLSRLTAPFWGFLVPWTLPLVIWSTPLVTATGFAAYVQFFVNLLATVLIYGMLAVVLVVNLVGLRVVAGLQLLLVAGLVIALLTFIVPGATAIEPANYTPFVPDIGAFAIAAVALFYPFLGFGLLTELGEEIDDPGRTIPIALFAGICVVTLVYVSLIDVLVGVVPYSELGTAGDVGIAARRFLPPWGVTVVALGALFAVATTVNTSLLVASRTVMRAARDGILPEGLAKIHPRCDTPYLSILVLGVTLCTGAAGRRDHRTLDVHRAGDAHGLLLRRDRPLQSAAGVPRSPRTGRLPARTPRPRARGGRRRARNRGLLGRDVAPATDRRRRARRLVRARIRLLSLSAPGYRSRRDAPNHDRSRQARSGLRHTG